MKRVFIAALLLILAVSVAVYSNRVFNKTTDDAIDSLYTLVDLSEQADVNALGKETDKFLARWEKAAKVLHILTIHSEMDTAESLINSLADLLESGETHEFRMACINSIAELRNLRDSERIDIDNIL